MNRLEKERGITLVESSELGTRIVPLIKESEKKIRSCADYCVKSKQIFLDITATFYFNTRIIYGFCRRKNLRKDERKR